MLKYYRNKIGGVISTIGTLDLPEITKAEFDAEMKRVQEKLSAIPDPIQKSDRELIEELKTKQDDLTLRQEDIELMIADAIGGAI